MTRREFILAGLGLLGAAAAGGVYSYVHRPKFGELPSGDRLKTHAGLAALPWGPF